MNAINWLLVSGGNAALWLWGIICAVFGALWSAFDWLANPVFSPILSIFNLVCTVVGDFVFAVLHPLPVWLEITILSSLAGLLMIVAFHRISNQKAIGRVKDEIKANLLALKLFKDQLHVTFKAQGRLFWAIVRFQWYMLAPILVLLPPMLLALAQMGVRYQWRPLHVGEVALVTLNLKDQDVTGLGAVLTGNPGMVVEAGPVPGGRQLVWRIRGAEAGRHTLEFEIDGKTYSKELVVGQTGRRVSAERPAKRWTAQILHPLEKPFPSDSVVQSIEIGYPGIDSWIYGADFWLLYFFVISLVVAFIAGKLMGVRF